MRPITRIVAYYRLSQPQRGKSKGETIRDAYGLEVQRRAVAKFAAEYNVPIIGQFTEIVSGKKTISDRTELRKAISMARLRNATLVIGKQDRLARNVRVIAGLLESGINFASADRPDQTPREILRLAEIDEEEARRISDRTKRGLAIARERGVKFGFANPVVEEKAGHLRNQPNASRAAGRLRHERCIDSYSFTVSIVRELLGSGMTYAQIADELNKMGYVTTAGNPFHPMAVCRVLKMFSCRPRLVERCCRCGQKFEITRKDKLEHEAYCRPFVCPDCADGSREAQHTTIAVANCAPALAEPLPAGL